MVSTGGCAANVCVVAIDEMKPRHHCQGFSVNIILLLSTWFMPNGCRFR